jgi:hypothetical protein
MPAASFKFAQLIPTYFDIFDSVSGEVIGSIISFPSISICKVFAI